MVRESEDLKQTMINQKIILGISELIREYEPEASGLFYDKLFNLLSEVFQFEYAAVFLYNSQKHKIELVAQKGAPVDLIELVSFELGKGFSAWVAQEKRIVLLNNLNRPQQPNSEAFKSFMSIPVLLEQDLVGVINFGHSKSYAFSEDYIPTLEVIATLLASIINHRQFIQQISNQNEKIFNINQALLETQERLIKAEQQAAISATAVSLNHEINNPLMIIEGNIHLLLEINEDKKLEKRLRIIHEQIARISTILQKLRNIENPDMENYVSGDSEMIIKID